MWGRQIEAMCDCGGIEDLEVGGCGERGDEGSKAGGGDIEEEGEEVGCSDDENGRNPSLSSHSLSEIPSLSLSSYSSDYLLSSSTPTES